MKTFTNMSVMAWLLGAVLVSGCAATGNTASTGEVIDDTVITARVKTAIIREPDLSASQINVETFKGVVQLSGFVTEASDIPRATQVAAAVPGVESVRNDIIVR